MRTLPVTMTALAFVCFAAAISSAAAQANGPRDNAAVRSGYLKKPARPASPATPPARGPSDAEARWMDRASAPSNTGGGGGGGGGGGM
jgi:hypothetical protein